MNLNFEPPIGEKARWMNWWMTKNKETSLLKANDAWGNRFKEILQKKETKNDP